MTLPDHEHTVMLIDRYLHATEDHAAAAAVELGMVGGNSASWVYVTGLIALSAGSDIRVNMPHLGGFFGLDPERASHEETAVLVANQLVAAAANQDQDTLQALLNARLQAALQAGADTVEQETCTRILIVTMKIARDVHRQWCPELRR